MSEHLVGLENSAGFWPSVSWSTFIQVFSLTRTPVKPWSTSTDKREPQGFGSSGTLHRGSGMFFSSSHGAVQSGRSQFSPLFASQKYQRSSQSGLLRFSDMSHQNLKHSGAGGVLDRPLAWQYS
jgi:hypothetical protein